MQLRFTLAVIAATITAISPSVLTAPACAAAYKATLLHPPSGFEQSFATGVFGNVQVGAGNLHLTGDETHALLWTGSETSFVDMHPVGYNASYIVDAADGVYVGQVTSGPTNGTHHAFMWIGSAANVVDLHPKGGVFSNHDYSIARAISGNTQVGTSSRGGSDARAVLWRDSASSVVDLHPTGYQESDAYDVSGGTQVGSGRSVGNRTHALLWRGTAASVVDLNPSGFVDSLAEGVSGDIQVGRGYISLSSCNCTRSRALMWRGTAESVVNLHPEGYLDSEIIGVSGNTQVGRADSHAMAWNGTVESAVDLHALLSDLPVQLQWSTAVDVDPNGTIVGYGYRHDGNFKNYAILWTPVPEPSTLLLAACGMAAIAVFTSRQHRTSIEVTDP